MSKLFQYLRTPVFRKNLILAVVAFFVMLLLVYVGLKIYTKHDESIAVPKVKGMQISAAIEALEKANLDYVIDSVYQMDATPGMVIDQDPEPNFHVKTGRTIYLTIITQVAPEVAFPDIKEKTLIEATALLKNHNLRIGDTIYVADIARDIVLDAQFAGQSLPTGRMVPKGSRIDLILGNGKGANEVEIPNLVGLPLEEGKFALIGAGLSLGNISFDASVIDTTKTKALFIVAQDPDIAVGMTSLGAKVNVTLSAQQPVSDISATPTTSGAPSTPNTITPKKTP